MSHSGLSSANASASTSSSQPKPAKSSASRPKKRFVGTSTWANSNGKAIRTPLNQIPREILEDSELNEAIGTLPSNYNFEIHKTVYQLRRDNIQAVALQMPEGLMLYGCTIGDILERFTSAHPILLADVTYGACCIDDFTARSLGAEMIVHYGHSCLIPTTQTLIKTLYVFVEISIDSSHLVSTIRSAFPSDKDAFANGILNVGRAGLGETVDRTHVEQSLERKTAFQPHHHQAVTNGSGRMQEYVGKGLIEVEAGKGEDGEIVEEDEARPTKLALVSTIQFVAAVQTLKDELAKSLPPLEPENEEEEARPSEAGEKGAMVPLKSRMVGLVDQTKLWRGRYEVIVPQTKPLSPGEILGCTAPKLEEDVDALIYVGDGRFHLESIMIANPSVPAFRYDPYDKKFTREVYEHGEMREVRAAAVGEARKTLVGVGGSTEDARQEVEGKGRGAWSVVLGTLGRQGNLNVLNTIASSIPGSSSSAPHPPMPILISELSPAKLSLFPQTISIFVQTSCPRLSIDWGAAFGRPVLTPYEASVAVGRIEAPWENKGVPSSATGKVSEKERVTGGRGGDYPMDFYSDDSLGPWTPRHGLGRPKRMPKPTAVPAVAA